ncbi:MAG: 50S ribosomal protein L29 [bacterium]|nr:50S ribosomal protein L29 [bacterium]
MKNKKISDLRLKKTDELKKLILEKKKEISLFLSEIVLQKEKNVKKGMLLRKEVARMLTILGERDI